MENHFNCIYCYTNKVNGKKYVGQTVDFLKRYKQHIKQAYNKKCIAYNQYFHNAIRKHGIENFEIEILKENLLNQEELNYWECYYIVEFDTLAKNGKGYNLASGGSNGNPYAGKTDEEMKEVSRKRSEIWKNKTDEEMKEIRRKNSETNKETMKNKSDEEKVERSRKVSETWKNKSDEELAEISKKISEATKGKNTGKKNGMYGHTGEKHPRARKVVSVDSFTMQTVFMWQYLKQATDFYGIGGNTLNRYLKGKAKSGHEYNGFLWYYLEDWQQLTK